MEQIPTISIKGKPIEHYLLNIYSIVLSGKKKFYIVSQGKSIANTFNLINFINSEILPEIFTFKIETFSEKKDDVAYSKVKIEVIVDDSKLMPA